MTSNYDNFVARQYVEELARCLHCGAEVHCCKSCGDWHHVKGQVRNHKPCPNKINPDNWGILK